MRTYERLAIVIMCLLSVTLIGDRAAHSRYNAKQSVSRLTMPTQPLTNSALKRPLSVLVIELTPRLDPPRELVSGSCV